MVKRGQLAWGASHVVRPVGTADASRVTGVFRRAADGFGFVKLSGETSAEDARPDVFITSRNAHDAASGDIVLVNITKQQGSRGKPEGVILEILERDTHRFVGVYFEADGQGFASIDGALFAQPILVGDSGAKSAQIDDKVVLEMVRFPSHTHDGEGVIVEVLGPRGSPGVDTLSIIREFELPDAFDDETLEEARREAEQFDESISASRNDFTEQTVVTIDPHDARDFDDAISLERLENGHWRLGVHIADVSHFVRPGTLLDREAYNRATSTYLPDRVIPMLPEIISNSLASLQPDRVRYAKTAVIEFTADGARVGTDLFQSAIRSSRRFTYEEVDDYLARPAKWNRKLTPEVFALLNRMHTLAMILRDRRMRRGALELTISEVKVDLDKQGRVCGAHAVEQTESHQIVEEFMLAANEAVADRLHEADWKFLRRVHPAPSPRKLKALTEFVKELGFPANNLQDRFELQKLLNDAVGQPQQHALHYAVLRSLPRAIYSPAEQGHFALASSCYCHFTSPIRRYPDLTVHRLMNALLAGKAAEYDFGQLTAQAEHCWERERRAESAERELTKIKLLAYLSDRIGQEMDAVVTGVESYGLFAQGVELPAEGLIHVASLDDDFYTYERTAHALVGRRAGNVFRLGDLIRVKVYRVDLERRQLDLRLVKKLKRSGRTATKKPAGKTTKPVKCKKPVKTGTPRRKKTSRRKGTKR